VGVFVLTGATGTPLESGVEECTFRGMSLSGDDAGVGDLESLCDADSWDINERTYDNQIVSSNGGTNHS